MYFWGFVSCSVIETSSKMLLMCSARATSSRGFTNPSILWNSGETKNSYPVEVIVVNKPFYYRCNFRHKRDTARRHPTTCYIHLRLISLDITPASHSHRHQYTQMGFSFPALPTMDTLSLNPDQMAASHGMDSSSTTVILASGHTSCSHETPRKRIIVPEPRMRIAARENRPR
jgi:hypothetical protein